MKLVLLPRQSFDYGKKKSVAMNADTDACCNFLCLFGAVFDLEKALVQQQALKRAKDADSQAGTVLTKCVHP